MTSIKSKTIFLHIRLQLFWGRLLTGLDKPFCFVKLILGMETSSMILNRSG